MRFPQQACGETRGTRKEGRRGVLDAVERGVHEDEAEPEHPDDAPKALRRRPLDLAKLLLFFVNHCCQSLCRRWSFRSLHFSKILPPCARGLHLRALLCHAGPADEQAGERGAARKRPRSCFKEYLLMCWTFQTQNVFSQMIFQKQQTLQLNTRCYSTITFLPEKV